MEPEFTPTSVEEITRMARDYVPDSILGALSRTALAYLARANAAEERADALDAATLSLEERLAEILGADEEELLGDAATRLVAERDKARRRLKARVDAVERDKVVIAARRERDDAQARVRELEAMSSTATILAVHKALGAASGESVVVRAEAVMKDIDDARVILGGSSDQPLADAAAQWVRDDLRDDVIRILSQIVGPFRGKPVVVEEEDAVAFLLEAVDAHEALRAKKWIADPNAQTVLDILGIAAGDRTDPIGRIKALVGAELERDYARDNLALLSKQHGWIIEALGWSADKQMGDLWDYAREVVQDLRAAREQLAAEAEPAQTFPIKAEVKIKRCYGYGQAGAEIFINGAITDPAFLALTGDQYARLALVVTRG